MKKLVGIIGLFGSVLWAQNTCSLLSNGWLGCTTLPTSCQSGVSPSVYLFGTSPLIYDCVANTYSARATGGGAGSVTSVSAGNLTPIFTSSVANPTSTPAITFTAAAVAQNSIFGGPATGGAGVPTFQTTPTFNATNLTNIPITLTTTGSSGPATYTQSTNTLNIPQYSGGGGSGTVTSFSAGTLSPLFTTAVATATTTPALTFSLSTFSADNIFGNFSGATAAPSTQAIPACANDGAHALVYPSHTLTCETITGGGSSAFSAITSGTNTAAAMLVGTGASLGFTGSGTVNANEINGGTVPTTALVLGSNGSNQPVAASLQGTDGKVMTAGTVSGTGASLCTDSNGGATTSGCTAGGNGNAAQEHSVTFSATPTFACTSSSAGTVDSFALSTALSANVTSSTLSGCTSGEMLNFVFQQAASGGPYTVAMPTGFSQACQVSPIASANTKMGFWWDGTTAQLVSCSVDSGPAVQVTESAPSATPSSGTVFAWADSTQGTLNTKDSSGVVHGKIASGSLALATSAISGSGGCQTVTAGSVNSATATGVLTTDTFSWTPNASIKGVTGYAPTAGQLQITPYVTAGFINFDVCNPTGSSITPGAVTLNWSVWR